MNKILSIFFTVALMLTFSFQIEANIGIVGGGPSGLSLAHELKKRGYKSVTVLERNREVGGKTLTYGHNNLSYEMGAIMSGPTYENVMALAKEFNEPIIKFSPGSAGLFVVNENNNKIEPLSMWQKYRYLEAARDYEITYRRYAHLFEKPGLAHLPAELNEPFSSWIKKNSAVPRAIEELLSHSFVSFGYGYMAEVPALYVLRFFSPEMLWSFVLGKIRMLENGYQNLWKKVAAGLKVEYNFDVIKAERIENQWVLRAKDGREKRFNVLVWTAPLDLAKKIVAPLAPQVSEVLEEIKYQTYYSTLVDIAGLPKGSGVFPRNYQALPEGGIVSWLHRWPSLSNVANFYTLSNQNLSDSQVEQKIREFATSNNLQVRNVIKNIGWRYFPHFSQGTLNLNPYVTIEAHQGQNDLYFSGEILNFSSVEHTVAYSKALADRFFSDLAKKTDFSFDLPNNYMSKSGPEKIAYLWEQIEKTEYTVLPSYETSNGSWLDGLSGFSAKSMSRAFSNQNDVIEKGRSKVIHKFGSTAIFSFQSADPGYQNFNGILRLSNAVDAKSGPVYPSFSIKIPLDGMESSINLNIGKSFDGQVVGTDPEGPKDFNFFRDHATYPFSNELPDIANSTRGKIFRWIFKRAHNEPNYIPVSEISKVMFKKPPRRLIFRAPYEIQRLMKSDQYVDERVIFAKIPANSLLFEVYESTGLWDSGKLVGRIFSKTPFLSSSFGDFNLYFRHEGPSLKKTPPSVGL